MGRTRGIARDVGEPRKSGLHVFFLNLFMFVVGHDLSDSFPQLLKSGGGRDPQGRARPDWPG